MSEGANEWRCRCRKPGPARLAGAAHTRAPASGGLLRPGHTASVATVPGGRPSPSPALCLWPAGSRVGRPQQGVERTEAALFLHSTPPFTTRPPFPQLRGGKCREDTESGWPCWSLCGCRALHRGPGGGLRGPQLPALSNPGLILGSLGALAPGAECPPHPGNHGIQGAGTRLETGEPRLGPVGGEPKASSLPRTHLQLPQKPARGVPRPQPLNL